MDASQNSAADADLASVFLSFAAFGQGGVSASSLPLAAGRLESRDFAKLARQAGLGLPPAVVDLAFKAAASGPGGDGRRVGWAGFLAAAESLAGRKGVSVDRMHALLASAGGPRLAAGSTAPQAVKWAEKANFTGVAARGGPTNVDGPRTLSALCDRAKKANVRGVPAGYGVGR